jgi:hypothetical protein
MENVAHVGSGRVIGVRTLESASSRS